MIAIAPTATPTILQGKNTHHIIDNIKQQHNPSKIFHVTTMELTHMILGHIRNRTYHTEFIDWLSFFDLIIVDFVDEISGRKKTQQVFRELFGTVSSMETQVIFTANKELDFELF